VTIRGFELNIAAQIISKKVEASIVTLEKQFAAPKGGSEQFPLPMRL
jgi:hypothetical protein